MAEQVPYVIAEQILTKLDSLRQRIRQDHHVSDQLERLKQKILMIKIVLMDAEKQQEHNCALQHWIQRLKVVFYHADDLLDEFLTHNLQPGRMRRQVSDFFSSSNQLALYFRMSYSIKDIRKRLDDVASEARSFNLISRTVEDNIHRERATHSFILSSDVVGRDENIEEIIKLLLSSNDQENPSIIAIVGVAGLGKTTLARLLYNDQRIKSHFDCRMWVYVSRDFDVMRILKSILEAMIFEHVEKSEFEYLAYKLAEELSEKKYFLVLDDVWNEDVQTWDAVIKILRNCAIGSKIVVTTQKKEVALMMGANSPIILEPLDKDHAWYLFSAIAFREGQEKVVDQEHFIDIGKEIVVKCKGVPFLIKTIASILSFKDEVTEWLSIKNNENIFSLGIDDISSMFKLSYDDLPIPLKQCFTYCTIFPKNYQIEKKLLVQLWIAQGYIQFDDGDQHLEDIGNQYFDSLLSRSLMEIEQNENDGKLCYKMHQHMHDFANSVIGPETLVLRENTADVSERVYHVSLSGASNAFKYLKGKPIRTLLNLYEDDFVDISDHDSIVNIIIPSFKRLRALSLSRMSVKKVPKFLYKLNHLRYLDLSNNDFNVLPNAITRLKNLQTLKLNSCSKLKKLPKSMRELNNLRHLENNGCENLTHLPCGIGELTMLQSLPVFVVGNGKGKGKSKDHKIGRLRELKMLNHLREELRIKNLENIKDPAAESSEGILREKQYIEFLRLEWRDPEDESGEVGESVMEDLRPHPNLKKLWIDGYKGVTFPTWMMNKDLSNLVDIVLFNCEKCKILPPFSQLPSIKSMWLSGLEEVEYITSSSAMSFFPSLQMLQLNNMPKLKGLWESVLPSEEPSPFPRLLKLHIGFCHELASLRLHSSPFLSALHIEYCDNLTSLLPPSPCLRELSVSTCSKLTSLELPPSPLSQLEIKHCDNLTSLLLHSAPFLSEFTLWNCHKLPSLAQPPSLRLSKLVIRYCPNLASLEIHPSPRLSSLEIVDCPKLKSLNVPSSPRLEKLHLNTISKEVLRQLKFVPAP